MWLLRCFPSLILIHIHSPHIEHDYRSNTEFGSFKHVKQVVFPRLIHHTFTLHAHFFRQQVVWQCDVIASGGSLQILPGMFVFLTGQKPPRRFRDKPDGQTQNCLHLAKADIIILLVIINIHAYNLKVNFKWLVT